MMCGGRGREMMCGGRGREMMCGGRERLINYIMVQSLHVCIININHVGAMADTPCLYKYMIPDQ